MIPLRNLAITLNALKWINDAVPMLFAPLAEEPWDVVRKLDTESSFFVLLEPMNQNIIVDVLLSIPFYEGSFVGAACMIVVTGGQSWCNQAQAAPAIN
jgi:hypothetical protein